MDFILKDHGDILEKTYYDFIIERIPAYELIWKIYIGNDGQNQMIELPRLKPEVKEQRNFVSQYHYTALESLVLMDLNMRKMKETNISSFKDNLEVFNSLLAFMANAGRVYDMVKKIGIKLEIEDLQKELYEYFQTRNEILHDKKIPYQLLEDQITIPIVESGSENRIAWSDKKLWNDMNPDKFEFLNDFIEDSFTDIASKLNASLYRALKRIKEICEKSRIQIQPNPKADYSNNMDSSGSGFFTSITVGPSK